MSEQNKVLFNIPQDKTAEEKRQARENIGAVGLGVQTGDDPFAAVPTMLVHVPTASASATVSFNGGMTTPVSMVKTPVQADNWKFLRAHYLNGQSFFTWDTVDIDSGRVVMYNIANGTTSQVNLYTNISDAIAAGKIPLVKYEETTNPSQYGYYWPMLIDTMGTYFVRVYGGAVKVLTVLTNDQITINTYPFDKFDMTNLAPQWVAAAYTRDSIVTDSGHVYRADADVGPANTPSSPTSNWRVVDIARLLGRVRNAAGEAALDPNNSTKWEVPNNALCEISTTATGPVAIEIDIAVEDAEVANAVINIISQEGGTVTVKKNMYLSQTHALLGSETCFYSRNAGNQIPANTHVQITCVGNRWTWEEYVDPAALQSLQNNAKSSEEEPEEKPDPVVEPDEKSEPLVEPDEKSEPTGEPDEKPDSGELKQEKA